MRLLEHPRCLPRGGARRSGRAFEASAGPQFPVPPLFSTVALVAHFIILCLSARRPQLDCPRAAARLAPSQLLQSIGSARGFFWLLFCVVGLLVSPWRARTVAPPQQRHTSLSMDTSGALRRTARWCACSECREGHQAALAMHNSEKRFTLKDPLKRHCLCCGDKRKNCLAVAVSVNGATRAQAVRAGSVRWECCPQGPERPRRPGPPLPILRADPKLSVRFQNPYPLTSTALNPSTGLVSASNQPPPPLPYPPAFSPKHSARRSPRRHVRMDISPARRLSRGSVSAAVAAVATASSSAAATDTAPHVTIHDLPDEVLLLIFARLSCRDVCNLFQVR